jgi:hypothetical protein
MMLIRILQIYILFKTDLNNHNKCTLNALKKIQKISNYIKIEEMFIINFKGRN